MKKIILSLLVTISMSSLSYCQLILEHTYNTSSVGGLDKYFFAFNTQNGLNHYTYEESTKTIKIYNETHSLVNTFIAPIPANFKIAEVYFVTDKLFNNDNLIEFLVYVYNNDGTTQFSKILLFNESSTLLQEFNNRSFAGIHKTNNDVYKLILRKNPMYDEPLGSTAILDVYTLPGTLSINQQGLLSKSFIAFPNPTDGTIKIASKLISGEITTVEVFDSSGKKVINKNVSGGFGEITLDVSNLSSGIYIYRIKGETGKFIKK